MSYRVKNIKNANYSPREIAYFLKFAKMYTRENIYVHSNTGSFISCLQPPQCKPITSSRSSGHCETGVRENWKPLIGLGVDQELYIWARVRVWWGNYMKKK